MPADKIQCAPRGRYFMTDQEERQAKAMTVLEFTEAKKHLAVLRSEADRFATLFQRLAEALRVSPERLSFDGESMESSFVLGRIDFKSGLLDQAKIQTLARDIRETIRNRDRLEERLKQMGLEV